MSRRWLSMSIVLAMMVWAILPLDAQARSRRRGPSAAQTKAMKAKMAAAIEAQVNIEKQHLASAQATAGAAEREIADANSKLETARESLASARSDQRSLVTELDDVEDRIIDDAGESSPIAKAAAEYDTAEDAMQHHEHRVLNSEEYHRQLAELEPGASRVTKVAELRTQMLENDKLYQESLARFQKARTEYNRLKVEVICKDSRWIAAAENLKNARHAETEANQHATSAGLQKLPAGHDLREANAVAASAQARIAAGEARIRSLTAGKGTQPKSGTSQTSTSKKK